MCLNTDLSILLIIQLPMDWLAGTIITCTVQWFATNSNLIALYYQKLLTLKTETEISKILAFHSTMTHLIVQDFSIFIPNENFKSYKKYPLSDKLMTKEKGCPECVHNILLFNCWRNSVDPSKHITEGYEINPTFTLTTKITILIFIALNVPNIISYNFWPIITRFSQGYKNSYF